MVRVRARLQEVTTPTVILQAREDDMTSPPNSSVVYNEISSKEKQLVLLDDCFHVITVDRQRETVCGEFDHILPASNRGKTRTSTDACRHFNANGFWQNG